MDSHVALKQLATELGLDRSNMRKYVISHGFSPLKMRTSESGRQLTLVVTTEEAEMIREMRQSEGFGETSNPVLGNSGYFYIIQVIPELAPNRIKLGFANDVQARLAAHRTAAPTAVLVNFWRCHRAWEVAAIVSVTRRECKLIANEVFECDNLETLVERAQAFFAIMYN